MSRAGLLLLAALAAGCQAAPSTAALDGGDAAWPAADTSAGQVSVSLSRSFGPEGEVPIQLIHAAGERLLALTDTAIYQLDHAGRVLHREALPVASSGTPARVTSASWDGAGLGAVVRWGQDTTVTPGSYLALTDARGSFAPGGMLALGAVPSAARVFWDSASQRHLVLISQTKGGQRELTLRRVPRAGSSAPAEPLLGGLPLALDVGGWVGPAARPAACTVQPPGRVWLHRFPGGGGPATALDLTDPGRVAVDRCGLATSSRAYLVSWVQRGLPPEQLDAGPSAPDLGPGSLSYDVPLVQLVDPDGKALARSLRLTLYGDGPAVTESLLWDGQRFLALVRTDYRGGRLLLTVLDESGALLQRDLELPLSYEPGRLLGGKLALGTGGDLWLVYALRRPDDLGVLYLARLRLKNT